MSLQDLVSRTKCALRSRSTVAKRDTRPASHPEAESSITDYAVSSEEEIARLEAALQELPDNSQLTEYLAFLYYSSRRFVEAIELYEELLKRDYLPAKQHYRLGSCFYRQGLLQRAREQWVKALEADPEPALEVKLRTRLCRFPKRG